MIIDYYALHWSAPFSRHFVQMFCEREKKEMKESSYIIALLALSINTLIEIHNDGYTL